MWNRVTKIKDQNCIHGCSFPLERGGFSVANQSAGKHWEQQSWVMFAVLRSWWVTGLCVSTETSTRSPHPLQWRSFLTQACLSNAMLHTEFSTAVRNPNVPWGGGKEPRRRVLCSQKEVCHLPEGFFPLTPPVLKSSLLFVRAATLQEAPLCRVIMFLFS